MSSPGARTGTLLKYGTVLGYVLACGGVHTSQVQRILEVAHSLGEEEAFDALVMHLGYQAGRRVIPNEVARLATAVLEALRRELGKVTKSDLLYCLGVAKMAYYTVSINRRSVCVNLRQVRSLDELVSKVGTPSELAAKVLAAR